MGLCEQAFIEHDAGMTQSTLRYSRTAMALHWAIALLLIFNFALGERSEDLKDGPELFWVMQLHKSIGITILLLSLWRLAQRLMTPRPAKAADGPILQKLSSAVHWGFYAVMILVPLSGWVLVSTAKVQLPTLLYGAIPWPHLPNFGHDVHEVAETMHAIMSKAMLPLLALHLIGAVRHQFILRDQLVERMVPVRRVSLFGFALLVISLVLAFVVAMRMPSPVGSPMGDPLPDFQSAERAPDLPKPPSVSAQTPVAPSQTALEEKAPVAAPVARWVVQPGGRLGFSLSVNGEQVNGQFSTWNADIHFDPTQLDKSRIRATASLASVASGDAGRDGMLAGEEFFGSAHPTALFTADTLRSAGGNRYRAEGSLRLKGVSRPFSLAFSLDIKGDRATAQGVGRLDRRDFGVGTGQFSGTDMIAADVAVNFAFTARRQAA